MGALPRRVEIRAKLTTIKQLHLATKQLLFMPPPSAADAALRQARDGRLSFRTRHLVGGFSCSNDLSLDNRDKLVP